MKLSITLILSLIFIGFILHSIWNLVILFKPPVCNEDSENCYEYFLNDKPKLDLVSYIHDGKNGKPTLILAVIDFNYDEQFQRDITIEIPKSVRKNGTLFIHTLIFKSRNKEFNLPLANAKRIPNSVYIVNALTQYAIPKSSTFNLLKEVGKEQSERPVAHLKKKYFIMMCNEEMKIPLNGIPMEIVKHFKLSDENNRRMLPIVMQDDLQSRIRDLEEITMDMESTNITFVFNPISIGKFKFFVQMQLTFSNFAQLGFTDKDIDEVKGVFADTNLYLLCATMLIGSIHLLLDFLSFKNDVSFWKMQRSMAGLSTRTVLWRSFSQTIIFLYLLDEGTSLLVLIPSGIGTLIEFWKVKKVLKASFVIQGFSIKLKKDKNETEEEAKTRQYDEESMKYLSMVLYPLVFAGAVYSLFYQPHKSWYSWTINSMVNGVYVFGFLFMLPQLFVNYRLKSVAALPWRAFTYRAFNTFIDDIFAFIITMPTAHRLACFRDDVVFLIYLYQRWLYPVDKNRIDDIGAETVDVLKDGIIDESKKIK